MTPWLIVWKDGISVTYKTYAGIGSRETPQDVLVLMGQIAAKYARCNWILRSGGARGADTAFAVAPRAELKQIFLPKHAETRPDWHALAARFHPAWDKCNYHAKLLHARNGPVVLGENLNDPVQGIVCWTPNAAITGGTGQALRIAAAYGIPVFNMANAEHRNWYEQWCMYD